jgi:hypothetical protein
MILPVEDVSETLPAKNPWIPAVKARILFSSKSPNNHNVQQEAS